MQSYILLIIVDDKQDSEFINEAMQATGLACVSAWADTKDRVFRVLSQMLPDFILLDLGLKNLNGLAFLEELKSSEKTREIPVILYCNPTPDELKKKAFDLGAAAFIERTKNSEAFSWALKSAINESEDRSTEKID
jgi:PleD family two-component response regulator